MALKSERQTKFQRPDNRWDTSEIHDFDIPRTRDPRCPPEEFMQDTKNLVRKFLLDNFVMGGNVAIADDASFMKGHILDSTGFIELILFIEETFGVKVDDDEMLPENFDSLLNIEGYVGRKRLVLATS